MGTLMRANTPVSRMMTTYTRRGPGQSYLKKALSSCFKKIIEGGDENLEINPLKVTTPRLSNSPHLVYKEQFPFFH